MLYKIGDTFHNDYTVIDILGGDGISGESQVYLIEHNETQLRIIAKTPLKKFGVWQGLHNLESENLITRLMDNHPNIVKSLGLVIKKDAPWMFIQYFEGVTLRKRLREGKMRFSEIVDWWVQIANAILHIRNNGQILLDLSVDNILVLSDNGIKLIDLGRSNSPEIRKFMSTIPFLNRGKRSGQYADLKALCEIVQNSYNDCLIEEIKRNPVIALYSKAEVDALMDKFRHMANLFDSNLKLTGRPGILTSSAAPREMSQSDDKIIKLLKRLAESDKSKDEIDFNTILKEFIEIHDSLPSHESCSLMKYNPAANNKIKALCDTAAKQIQCGQNHQALLTLEMALNENDVYLPALSSKATLLQVMGRTSESNQHFEKCLHISQYDLLTLMNFGASLVEQRQYIKAITLLKKALVLAPHNEVAINSLGLAYEETGNLVEAKYCYEKALEKNPSYNTAKKNLTIVMDKLNRMNDSEH